MKAKHPFIDQSELAKEISWVETKIARNKKTLTELRAQLKNLKSFVEVSSDEEAQAPES